MLRTRVRAGAAAGLVLSLVFAGLFTLVSVFDLYFSAFAPRLGERAPVTLRVPYGTRMVFDRARTSLSYEHARVIIPMGRVLDESGNSAAAFAYESIRRPLSLSRLASFYVIYFIVCQMLTAYLRRFGQS